MKPSFSAAVLATVIFALTLSGAVTVARAQDTYFGARGGPGAPSKLVNLSPTPSPSPTATPPAAFSAKDIKIITSVWGSEHKFVDVTARLADVFSHPALEYEIGPEWLQSDPFPGAKKVIVTVFDVNGVRYVMGNHEGIKLSLHKFQDYVQSQSAAAKVP